MIPAKRLLRSWRCPIYEARNRIVGAGGERRNRAFQTAEVQRLRRGLDGSRPQASVCVVIPTYRRPQELLAAVDSALGQSYGDLAVVVVDDGAGLPELPDDPRLTAVSLSRNSATAGVVRNVGMALADSDLIAFLDDDNTWTEDHLETAVAALAEDRTLDAVYTSIRRLWPDGTQLDVLGETFDRHKLRWDPYVDTNSIVVRRTANCGFSVLPRPNKYFPREDWEYVWRLSRRGRIAHVPKVTVRYAVNPDSFFTKWTDDQG